MFYSYSLKILFWKIGFFVIQSFPLTFLGKHIDCNGIHVLFPETIVQTGLVVM